MVVVYILIGFIVFIILTCIFSHTDDNARVGTVWMLHEDYTYRKQLRTITKFVITDVILKRKENVFDIDKLYIQFKRISEDKVTGETSESYTNYMSWEKVILDFVLIDKGTDKK